MSEGKKFKFEKFPENKIWEFAELNVFAREYPMTLVQMETFWQNLVKNYEEFRDLGKGEIYRNPPPKFKVINSPAYILVEREKMTLYDKNRNELQKR